ncbi:MAG TPA: DnaJ domain-containing protein, partial [Polyangiaceae bacterium]|nr:DnaJ domain-containing protein [Polyangiaceae bacterium]
MTRKLRLAARYAVDLPVRLQGASWPQPKEFRARDISRGGLFVRTEEEPEIFTDVRMWIALPWGGELDLRARIVHIMGAQKAKAVGIEPGLGIEFHESAGAEKETIEQLVRWARDSDPNRAPPQRTDKPDPGTLNPMMSYVLGAVDGQRAVDDIAEWLQLEVEPTAEVLKQLAELGMIQVGKAVAQSFKPPAPVESLPVSRPSLDPGCTLSDQERAAIDQIAARLMGDHYQVLAVLPSADREQIRAAYLALSRQFHPDAYGTQKLGEYRKKLLDIFDRLTEAYAALSNVAGRAQYDAYLRRSAVLPEPTGTSIGPGMPSLPAQRPSPAPAAPVPSPAPSTSTAPPVVAQVAPAPALPQVVISKPPPTVRYDTATASRVPLPAAPVQAPVISARPSATDAGSLDMVRSYLDRATAAFKAGDLKGAAGALDFLEALKWDRPDLRATYQELEQKVTVALADTYEQQARYEQKHQRWRHAARSWLKVCRGKPNDPECHRAAAEALLAMKGDLHKARNLAQRAVELAPTNALARRVLGHVYLEAGLHLNARRELEVASALNRNDADTKQLLSRIPGAKPSP